MCDLSDYWARQTETKLAEQESSTAHYRAEIARMKERAAELKCQNEPLASLIGLDILSDEYVRQRKNILDAIFYVVVGRFPSK